MPSIHPNYEYDIFISYRHNDNKRDKWVTQFVEALRDELEATLKNPVSIYFDENPHDGLLETHDVDRSLEKKLKCLIFIPIISQTYCDAKCFAWEHELLPFVEFANKDELGMNITLSNGNVASRVLPIRIHDIDEEDTALFEKTIDGHLRSIDFIYKETGVNRPLLVGDDRNLNLEKSDYLNQINKVANALKNIGMAILRQSQGDAKEVKSLAIPIVKTRPVMKGVFIGLALVVILLLTYFGNTSIYNSGDSNITNITIAVLPFANTKPDPETDYLGFSIANQIIGELVYNKNITVRPSSAVRKYDKQVFDAAMVADDLKVAYVLTGNYLKISNIIRLDIELVEAHTNEVIWLDKIEIDFNNAFELQDIVAQKVVGELKIQFTSEELNTISKDTPSNPLAYEYYLRSISYPLLIDGDQLAIEMLNKSIELDSNFAPAYAELGFRVQRLAFFGLRDLEEINRAEKIYLKALFLNEELLSALGSLAKLYTETARTEKAVEFARKMLDINPNYHEAHYSLGYIYRYTGMLNESIEEMEIAVDIDSKNPRFRSLGVTYMNVYEYEKAFDAFDIDKGSTYSLGYQGILHLRQNNLELAIEYFDRVIAMEPDGLWGLVATTLKAFIQGRTEDGLIAVNKLEQADLFDAEAWYFWAGFYSLLGDRDGCIRALRRAVDGGYFNYPFMLTDSFLDSVRDDLEFQQILQKAQTKHEAFKSRYFLIESKI